MVALARRLEGGQLKPKSLEVALETADAAAC
jgi:hypothetical protein